MRACPDRTALPRTRGLLALAVFIAAANASCNDSLVPTTSATPSAEPQAALPPVISPRAIRLPDFPCMQCHDKIPPKEGEIAVPLPGHHRDMQFAHFEGITDCGLCHDLHNMNSLQQLTGTQVPFDDAYQVCGGCHGIKLRDWQLGAHGKQVGSWQRQGVKNRYNCPDCHDAHAPQFPKMVAKPPPPVPKFHIPKGGAH